MFFPSRFTDGSSLFYNSMTAGNPYTLNAFGSATAASVSP